MRIRNKIYYAILCIKKSGLTRFLFAINFSLFFIYLPEIDGKAKGDGQSI